MFNCSKLHVWPAAAAAVVAMATAADSDVVPNGNCLVTLFACWQTWHIFAMPQAEASL